jgi:Protein of unknown function (DUF3667)
MEHEMEAAGLGSAGGLSTGEHHPVKSGQPCANCETIVGDRFCTACGQLASDFHRPVWDLVASSLADVFALDGRLWRSLPLLLFRPGRMTRNYLDGKRARYVPPFRMFLLTSVIFFLTLFTLGDQLGWYQTLKLDGLMQDGIDVGLGEDGEPIAVVSDDRIEELRERSQDPDLSQEERDAIDLELMQADGAITLQRIMEEGGRINRDALYDEVNARLDEDSTPAEREQAWRAADHAATVYENQDRYGARIREWAPRISIMFMPILAFMLTILYAWHRSRYIYDHVVTALHVQTFIYLLATVSLLLAALNAAWISNLVVGGLLIVLAYIYRQLRVTYQTGRLMAALRTFILLFTSFIVLFSLALALIVVSFVLI